MYVRHPLLLIVIPKRSALHVKEREKRRKENAKEYLHPKRNPFLFEKNTLRKVFLVVASSEGSHATRYTTYQK